MVLPVIGNGARITACPIFNFAVRFVADNVRNDGVEIGCNDLYFFFFFNSLAIYHYLCYNTYIVYNLIVQF